MTINNTKYRQYWPDGWKRQGETPIQAIGSSLCIWVYAKGEIKRSVGNSIYFFFLNLKTKTSYQQSSFLSTVIWLCFSLLTLLPRELFTPLKSSKLKKVGEKDKCWPVTRKILLKPLYHENWVSDSILATEVLLDKLTLPKICEQINFCSNKHLHFPGPVLIVSAGKGKRSHPAPLEGLT